MVPTGFIEPLIVAELEATDVSGSILDSTEVAGCVMAFGSREVVVVVFVIELGGQLPVNETPDTKLEVLPTFWVPIIPHAEFA